MQPKNPIKYVNSQSNHPPCILRNIPSSVNKRLSELSASEEIFKNAVPQYQEALDNCGYSHKLVYSPPKKKNIEGVEEERLYGTTHPGQRMSRQILENTSLS